MEYLLKVSALLAIFYVSYKVFLQRDTFFNENRWFLILGIVTAFVLPSLVIPIYIEYTPVDAPNFNNIPTEVSENIETPFNILDYLPIIYLLGVIGFSIRFLIQLTSLSLVISKSKKEKHGKYTYIKTDKNISPFSFFNWIVFNPNNFNNNELEQILIHEKIHSNQKHSIDVLLTQLSCIALWFNPLIWFYNKALKQNLEFIADNETQHQIDCKKTYQITLLKTSLPSHQMALTNNFHTSLIKKRIVMLHKSKSKKISLFKYTLIIPLLFTFIFNFNTEVIAQTKEQNINITGKSDSEVPLKLEEDDNPLIIIDGKTSSKTNLEHLNHSNIESINILKGNAATQAYGNKGDNGVMLITTKQQSQWKVSSERNKNVIHATKDTIYVNEKPNVLQKLVNGYDKEPLFILDDKTITKKELTLLDEQTINSISTIKGEQATKKYGKNANNGVVVIKTRTADSQNSPFVKIVKVKLYIVDGEEIKEADFQKIDPENIKSINVLKGKSAIDKYGEKAKNGAIEITTKNNNQNNSDSLQTKKTQHKLELAKDKQPLVYVDNEEVNYEDLKNLDTENIESMNVLKNKNATDKYGDKGKNGVIEITTKK
ncbi:M56 family metallopeptidase [Algibacter sp. L3A6]|uniref:M56 family metallopeptidase n=1 Tax=Algibacter sp. L3A6 TaxID=2686366 RepID=UPI00131E0B1D|nr:M56 family metallopeptidase [Algibacter sp. L3A6]